MIISVEGIDGAGKTTLCNALSGRLEIPVLDLNTQMIEPQKRGYCMPNFDRDSWKVAAVALETLYFSKTDAILDRTTLSCWAYQQRKSTDLVYLEQVIEHVKPMIVLVDTPVDVCVERDPEAADRWGTEGLIWQRHRMMASGECFSSRGVPYMVVNGFNSKRSNVDLILDKVFAEGVD